MRSHPEGLTLTSIAEFSKLHRHTATKYIYELRGAGLINEREIGSAKLCCLRSNLSKIEEKTALKRLNGEKARKSTAGQAQLLTILLFLFLIPSTIIIAQNATLNESFSGMVIDSGSGEQTVIEEPEFNISEPIQETISIETEPEIPLEENETLTEENQSLEIPEESIMQNETDYNETETNQTISEYLENATTNETNQTELETLVNETEINQTIQPLENITETEISAKTNQTEAPKQNITNETKPETEINITLLGTPMLVVDIYSPDRFVRGKEFLITSIMNNTGSAVAKDVVLEWELPEGLSIVEGSASKECGDLLPESSCTSEIEVLASLSAPLGRDEIKVLVRYLD